jgi:hypothetical protein
MDKKKDVSENSEKSDDCCSNKSCCEMDVQKDCEYECSDEKCSDKECSDEGCGSCSDEGGCCSKRPELDVSSLSSDAKELHEKFESVQNHLEEALKLKHDIIMLLHKKKDKKEEFEKVLHSQHPVIIQFVLEIQ